MDSRNGAPADAVGANTAPTSAARTHAGVLDRGLRARDATAIIVGGIIGSGIFVSPGVVARHVTTPATTLLVWARRSLVAQRVDWIEPRGAHCGQQAEHDSDTYRYHDRDHRQA